MTDNDILPARRWVSDTFHTVYFLHANHVKQVGLHTYSYIIGLGDKADFEK